MNQGRVIIVGYPKSGNTWLTRLTAELLNSPVKGFLYAERDEIAIEGKERSNTYQVYKSHHQLHEFKNGELEKSKIIYIYRDPRDVSLSGAGYFYKQRNFFNSKYYLLKLVNKLISKFYQNFLDKKAMLDSMINAVLNGDANLNHWCRVSWKTHVLPYLSEPQILVIKYEDLLKNTRLECDRLLEFLEVDDISEKAIETAIHNQTFEVVKKKFLRQGKFRKAFFLRSGKAEQWRKRLSKSEKEKFVLDLGDILEQMGYPLR